MIIEYEGYGEILKETNLFNEKIRDLMQNSRPTEEMPIQQTRKMRDCGKGIFPFLPEISSISKIVYKKKNKEVGVRLSKGNRSDCLFLFIHGGGWTFGRPRYEDHWCSFISKKVGCDVGAIEYRLAPENPWPACLDDSLLAASWAIQNNKYKKIIIGGESAGAHLSASVILKLQNSISLKKIVGAVFTYGLYDLRLTPSSKNWGKERLILSTPTIKWFIDNLGVPKKDLENPYVSPLLSEIKNMPPAIFQCGTLDPLRDDTAFMASRWSLSGADTKLVWYKNGVHAFDKFDLKISDILKENTITFLKENFFNT